VLANCDDTRIVRVDVAQEQLSDTWRVDLDIENIFDRR
jgi:hypothetical protein